MTRKWIFAISAGIIALGFIFVTRFVNPRSDDDNAPTANFIQQNTNSENPIKAGDYPHLPLREPRLSDAESRAIDSDPFEALASDPNNLDLLVVWASRDPQAAMAWIEGGERAMSYEHMLGAIATGVLLKDGVEAMNRYVEKHQNDEAIPPKNRGELEKYVFFNLGREDTIDTALSLLHGSDSSDLAGMMVLGVKGAQEQIRAIDYLEAKGIPVSVSYWEFQESVEADPQYWADWADQRNSDMLTDIVQSWARQEPEAAKNWLHQRIPANDPRRKEIDERLAP